MGRGAGRDIGRFDWWAPDYNQDPVARRPGPGGRRALPFANASFDLVTSTVSFHHWNDQRAGLAEAGRVLASGGVFVLADLHAVGY